MKDRKGVDLAGRGSGEELRGRETINGKNVGGVIFSGINLRNVMGI